MTAQAARRSVLFITHAEVAIDPAVPVQRWGLSERGRARHAAFNGHPATAGVRAIYCSAEQKAREGAEILARHHGVPVQVVRELGENDRSATGYLPPPEFERAADAFFAHPDRSIQGWERAVDAQHRVVRAVGAVLDREAAPTVAIVAHGGVGALLLAHLLGEPISRRWDQPGRGGGNFFVFDPASRVVVSGWQPIG